ncbi:MAG: hypothetical protein ACYC35_17185 [Pirellulales bacterium]
MSIALKTPATAHAASIATGFTAWAPVNLPVLSANTAALSKPNVSTVSTWSASALELRALYGEILLGWYVSRPIYLAIEHDEVDGYVVSDEHFGVYGAAATKEEAIRDYAESLVEYYEILSARADDPGTRNPFKRLRAVVQHP